MHPGGMRSAMDLFDFEKSANLKHPNAHAWISCFPHTVFLKSRPFCICHCSFWWISHFSHRGFVITNNLDLSMHPSARFPVPGIADYDKSG